MARPIDRIPGILTRRRRGLAILGIGLMALVSIGCQGRGDVSGRVTFQGKPLVFGTVLFAASDGNSFQANIDKDGRYTVRGLRVGDARVAVNSPNPKGITLVYKDPKKKPAPYPDAPGWFAIPNRYETVATSGLTYTIKGGENTIDIELQ